MKKTIVYGIGEAYKNITSDYFVKNNKEYLIIAVTDKKNPPENFDSKYKFINRYDLNKDEFDIVLVTSNKYFKEIKDELVFEFHIEPEKIISLQSVLSVFYARDFHYELFKDKTGIEVGGPSLIFEDIYDIAKTVDGVNFSANTIWWDKKGNQYTSKSGQILGDIIIADAVDLSVVKDSTYDFYISSNNLEHIANPMKAVSEMLRIVKKDGVILVILPKKDTNFDHNREFTTFEHILDDYKNNIGENDLTHLKEILEKHDYDMDKPCGGKEKFYERALKNFENRGLHHHVFSPNVLKRMFNYFGVSTVIECGELRADYFILVRKYESII